MTTNAPPVTVTVVAPEVDSFTVTSTPWAWQPDQSNKVGFTVQQPITIAASVFFDSGGTLASASVGLIQKIDRTDTVKNSISGVPTLDTGGSVLDTLTSATNPNGSDYLYVGSLTSIHDRGSGGFSGSDYPNTIWNSGTDKATGKFDYALDVKTTITLEDHLVFNPGGICVNLATSSPVVMSGEESYDVNKQQWSDVVAPSPSTTTTVPTHQDYNIVTWTNWYGNPAITWNPPYNFG